MMKKIITLLLILLVFKIGKAQTFVTIPDPNFVSWLQTNFPTAMIGNQMDITNTQITTRFSINLSNQSISNLTGIQYFTSLIDLKLNNCSTTLIPSLPNNLKYFECNNNLLTSLPSLPSSLLNIKCSYNQITVLPILPPSLINLYCNNNQISTLPFLPLSLKELDCSYNLLNSLPNLPTALLKFDCSFNNISCFPFFPDIDSIIGPAGPISYINISNNPFTCLPNYVPGMDSITLTYPLCVTGNTLTNPNGCSSAEGITGVVFADTNLSCTQNPIELLLPNIPIKIYDNSNNYLGMTNTIINGSYYFGKQIGTYNVVLDTLYKPYTSQCINPGLDSLVTISPLISMVDSVDFAVNCKPGFDVGIQSIARNGFAFPGQTHTLTIVAGDMSHWYNLNCASGLSGTLSFSVSGPVTFLNPAPGSLIPTVVGNLFTYNISDFGFINNLSDFKLIFTTDTIAQGGDLICITATINPIIGDNQTSNNTYQFCYSVLNSCDPNIKEVYPVSVQNGFQDWLTYSIYFQNIGNAPAINIKLTDTLDSNLNPETLEIINYSHNNQIDLIGNVLKISFPSIYLQDSLSNPLSSIGFIQYRIKPKTSWTTPDTINNKAYIYFDYNSPIVTNSAKTFFENTSGINDNITFLDNTIQISPNPSAGMITIKNNYVMKNITIYNVSGQIIISETCDKKLKEINLEDLSNGIYFIRISYLDGFITTKKIIKQ